MLYQSSNSSKKGFKAAINSVRELIEANGGTVVMQEMGVRIDWGKHQPGTYSGSIEGVDESVVATCHNLELIKENKIMTRFPMLLFGVSKDGKIMLNAKQYAVKGVNHSLMFSMTDYNLLERIVPFLIHIGAQDKFAVKH